MRRFSTGLRWSPWCFPTFKDGRAYSQARQLRERYGFRGELRATGDVLRDQFLFLARAGFDAFEVKKDADAAAFGEAIARYSVFYQPAGDGTAVQRARRVMPAGSRRPGARGRECICASRNASLAAIVEVSVHALAHWPGERLPRAV